MINLCETYKNNEANKINRFRIIVSVLLLAVIGLLFSVNLARNRYLAYADAFTFGHYVAREYFPQQMYKTGYWSLNLDALPQYIRTRDFYSAKNLDLEDTTLAVFRERFKGFQIIEKTDEKYRCRIYFDDIKLDCTSTANPKDGSGFCRSTP